MTAWRSRNDRRNCPLPTPILPRRSWRLSGRHQSRWITAREVTTSLVENSRDGECRLCTGAEKFLDRICCLAADGWRAKAAAAEQVRHPIWLYRQLGPLSLPFAGARFSFVGRYRVARIVKTLRSGYQRAFARRFVSSSDPSIVVTPSSDAAADCPSMASLPLG